MKQQILLLIGFLSLSASCIAMEGVLQNIAKLALANGGRIQKYESENERSYWVPKERGHIVAVKQLAGPRKGEISCTSVSEIQASESEGKKVSTGWFPDRVQIVRQPDRIETELPAYYFEAIESAYKEQCGKQNF